MQNHCCRNRSADNVQIKQRYIPTFVHQPIFQPVNSSQRLPRYNPTFCSTALDTEGYNIKIVHQRKPKIQLGREDGRSRMVYSNYSRERRLQDLNPKLKICYQTRDKWFDHTKENGLNLFKNSHNTQSLRLRKILELASAPVFTDFDYQSTKKNDLVNFNNRESKQKQAENPQKQVFQGNNLKEVKTMDLKKDKGNQTEQNKVIETQNQRKKSKYQEQFDSKSTKLNQNKYHQNQNTREQKIIHEKLSKKALRLQKPKVVSKQPTFSLVRGNKIDNRL